MGKVVKKVLTAALIIVSAGLLIPVALAAGLSVAVAYGLVGIQLLGVSKLITAFDPEFDIGNASRQLSENLSIYASPLAIRGVPFGRVGIAGQILFRHNIKNSGDTPDELLLILGLGGYPVTSLEKFWFNDELVFDGDSTTGPGAITTGTFADDLWVWFRTGEETSAAFPDIATLSSSWNAKTRILRGIPSIGIRIKVTEKVDGKLQPLAQIKGAKLYDPRLDSTVPGGSGAHRFATPATWEWSENPKLSELIYLRGADVNGTRIFGMGKAAAAIDLENFASEANICEEQIDVVGGGTIDRYTCNGLLIPSSNHKNNLQRFLSASAGTMDASGGIYRTFAGAWRASSMTLTESDIDGAPTEIQLQIDQSDEVNIISGSFADPNDKWVVKEYPEISDATSIASFGENAKKLDLPFTVDHRIAQRISKIQLKRLNAKRAFNANYWTRSISLQPGDNVTQTYARYGITSETFRVDFWALEASVDRQSNRRLVVPLRLVEEQQSWFDWDEATEEQSTSTITSLPSVSRLPRLITLDENVVFEGASPPADPKIGWLWLDTDVNIVFRWSGSAWVEFSRIGADGSDGNSTYVALVYKRAASAPSTPSADDGSYNFSTSTLTPPSTWSTTPPASDGNPLYVSQGAFEIQGTTGTDNTVTWTAPVELVSDGADGDTGATGGAGPAGSDGSDGNDGNSVHFASVFKRSASSPSTPTGGSYNFSTQTLTPPSTWSATPPASDGNPLYVSTTIAEVNGTTGTDSTLTWTAPAELVSDGADGATGVQGGTGPAGSDGSDGSDGNSVHVSTIYRRSASAPSTPTGGSFNFTTNTLTAPTNWYAAPPSGSDPLYASVGTWSISGVTGTDTSTTWSSPAQQDPGAPAASAVQAYGRIITDIADSPTNARAGLKVDADGDIYYREGDSASWVSMGTWLLDGSAGDYDCKLEILGTGTTTSLDVGTQDVFLDCGSDNIFEQRDTSTSGGLIEIHAHIVFRHGTTYEILSTAYVELKVAKYV